MVSAVLAQQDCVVVAREAGAEEGRVRGVGVRHSGHHTPGAATSAFRLAHSHALLVGFGVVDVLRQSHLSHQGRAHVALCSSALHLLDAPACLQIELEIIEQCSP